MDDMNFAGIRNGRWSDYQAAGLLAAELHDALVTLRQLEINPPTDPREVELAAKAKDAIARLAAAPVTLEGAARDEVQGRLRAAAGKHGRRLVEGLLEDQGTDYAGYDQVVNRGETGTLGVVAAVAFVAHFRAPGAAREDPSGNGSDHDDGRCEDEYSPKPSRFVLEDFDTLEPGELVWVVKGLWPAVGVCFVVAPPGAGKSFWTIDAIARVCRGEPVLGRKSIPCGAAYIAAEGAAGVKNRMKGLRQRIGPLHGMLKYVGQRPTLNNPDDVAELEAFLLDAKAQLDAAGHRLGIVVVDTLAASTPGADENTSKDMGAVMDALQGLSIKLECLVLVIAHTGKDVDRGLRGWSGMGGNADGLICIGQPVEGTRVGLVDKVKDGPSKDRFAFSLEEIEIGVDADGDKITTCVVVYEDLPEEAAAKRPGRKPTKAAADAEFLLRAFRGLDPEKLQQRTAPGLSPDARAVDMEELRRAALNIGLGPSAPVQEEYEDAKDWRTAHKRWLDNRRNAFDRARDYLINAKKLRLEEGKWLWLLDE